MTDFPNLKLKTLVSFPARVTGGAGVDVVKQNGNYQFSLGFGDFVPPVPALPPADIPNLNVLAWNKVTGQYWLTPIPLITNGILEAPNDGTLYGRKNLGWTAVSTGGIADAPNDGVQYGRQSLGWTPVSGGSFIQAGAGAVTRPMQDKARERISVKDFGAVGNFTTDDTAAIAAAIAATPSGGTLYIPTGGYRVVGSGSAIFSYAKPISIVGDGFGSLFYIDASVPATRDIFYINPTSPTQGGGLFNFEIVPASGTPARYGIHVDTTANASVSYQGLKIDGVYCAQLGGNALFLHGRSDGWGVSNSYFTKSSFQGGVQVTFGGDSLVFANSQIGGTQVGILASLIVAAGNLVIRENNIAVTGHEAIVIDSGVKPIITGNEIEHAFSATLAGSAMINLRGATAALFNPTIHGNQIQVVAGMGDPVPILIGAASDTNISLNRVNACNGVAHIINSASATRTNISMNNVWTNNDAAVDLKMTDSGSGTIAPETAWTAWSPTVTMVSGALATATGLVKKIGKVVDLQVQITATGAAVIDHLSLPYAVAGPGFALVGRDGSTNFMWQGIAQGSNLYVTRYDASQTLGTTSSIALSGVYQST